MTRNDNHQPQIRSLPPLQRRPIAVAIQASLISLSLACASAHAANLVVDSLDDNGSGCTLREAIESANTSVDLSNGCAAGSDSNTDIITFDSNAFTAGNNTITLANGELALSNKNVTIDASAISGGVVIDASRASRVMSVTGGSVSLDSLTITGGSTSSDNNNYITNGAGLEIGGGASVTIANTLVNDNRAGRYGGGMQYGGGIHIVDASTHVTISDSVISNNFAEGGRTGGGGISLLEGKLEVSSSEISDNTVTGSTSNGGSGIFAKSGEFSLYDTIVTRNSIAVGAIQSVSSSMLIVNSEVSHNAASGFEINDDRYNDTPSIIRGSTISHNSSNRGEALYFIGYQPNVGAQLIVEDTTISHNTNVSANDVGVREGSITVLGGRVDFRNSTISNNVIRTTIVSALYSGSVYFDNVTIADNQADGFNDSVSFPALPTVAVLVGDNFSDGKVNFKNSIISNPDLERECFTAQETVIAQGVAEVSIDDVSIIRDGSCGAVRTGDAGLLPLADNGGTTLAGNRGTTLTHALAAGSIAINTGDTATCLSTDQRGATRDQFCDVGAFEFGASVPVDEPEPEPEPDNTQTFVIPLPNGKTVIFDL